MPEPLLTRYLQPLLAGRRAECFSLVRDALQQGRNASDLIQEVVWPAMTQVDRLFRDDRINTAIENLATRINRTIADQLQTALPSGPPRGRRVLITCAAGENEELGAQMVADLFQADGWEVYFLGGGVPQDEIATLVGQLRPQLMVIFGTQPTGVPGCKALIDEIRHLGVVPHMNIVVSGGVFNRADGLWNEVGADRFVSTAEGLIELANHLGPRDPNTVRSLIVKKRKRKRKGQPTPAVVAS
ncbi:MAG: B12-binding domain-containing protein [Phycisphaerae bacterium]